MLYIATHNMHGQGLLAADGGERNGMEEILVGILEVEGNGPFVGAGMVGKREREGNIAVAPKRSVGFVDKVGAVCSEGGIADFGFVVPGKPESTGDNVLIPEKDG